MVVVAKALLVEAAVAFVALGASTGLDGTAERIVLYSAAGAGLLWFYMNILRPLSKVIVRLLRAVDHLEQVPQTAQRVRRLERWAWENRSALLGMARELGIQFRYDELPQPEDQDAED